MSQRAVRPLSVIETHLHIRSIPTHVATPRTKYCRFMLEAKSFVGGCKHGAKYVKPWRFEEV